jgi:hypothetical protein
MVCVHCQNEMRPQERFCSKCGKDSTGSGSPIVRHAESRDWEMHVKVLAWIFIISAILMAVPGLSLLVFPGILMMGLQFHPFYLAGPLFLVIAFTFISIPVGIVIAGIGLLRHREWARVLTLIMSAFMLIGFPFGTAIGIYAFWVLLSNEGSAHYRNYPSPEGRGWAYSGNGAPGEG